MVVFLGRAVFTAKARPFVPSIIVPLARQLRTALDVDLNEVRVDLFCDLLDAGKHLVFG